MKKINEIETEMNHHNSISDNIQKKLNTLENQIEILQYHKQVGEDSDDVADGKDDFNMMSNICKYATRCR